MAKSSKSKKVSKSNKPAKQPDVREVMSEGEAARACVSLFLREGVPEGNECGEFEIVDVSFDDDGEYFAMVKVRVGNLDVELASNGTHLDQDKINEIKAEQESA